MFKMKHHRLRLFSLVFAVILLLNFLYCYVNHFSYSHPISSTVYLIKHKSINDVNPKINYKNTTKHFLHIDSYTIKNKNDIYFDSLLERYNYYSLGNYNYVASYSGSHGIIDYHDPITRISKQAKYRYYLNIALNQGLAYTNYDANLNMAFNYANGLRTMNIADSNFYKNKIINGNKFLKKSFQTKMVDVNVGMYDLYLIKNTAPNEVFNAEIDSPKDGYLNKYYTGDFSKNWQKYLKRGYTPYYRQYIADGGVFNSRWFLTSKIYPVADLKQPTDLTNIFSYDPVNAYEFYQNLPNNVLYSNGNIQLLQEMYQEQNDLRNYHLIDVYHHGFHLNPLMFNIFVRANNRYRSPYSFNYRDLNQAVWQKISNNKRMLKQYISSQDYNLPANYDKKHYYYRTIEGTLISDNNIEYVNKDIKPLIMGKITLQYPMPHDKKSMPYYLDKLSFTYAKRFNKDPLKASQQLNFKRSDGGFQPLWKIGLVNDPKIGTYHPGEILRYNDQLSKNKISKYYIVERGQKLYLPVYNVENIPCFKAIVTFKGQTRYYVRCQDAYMLMGEKIQYE